MRKLNYIHRKISRNKDLEIQWQAWSWRDAGRYFDFHTHWTTQGDHAGFVMHFEIMGWFLNIEIYDWRHWDYENNGWAE